MNGNTFNLDAFFDLSIDMLCIASMDGCFLKVNDAFRENLGYEADEMVGELCLNFIHPEDKSRTQMELQTLSEGQKTIHFENRYLTKDGRYAWMEWSAYPERESNLIYAVARNMTEQKKAYARLLEMTEVDNLTKLYNRYAFENIAKREIRRAVRFNDPICLMLIDIDDFKQYNDTYGHLRGDECLKHVAHILNQNLSRNSDYLFRYGGDEFIALLPQDTLEEGLKAAENLRKSIDDLQMKHEAHQSEDHITITIGVTAITPTKNTQLYELITQADGALYHAKKQHRNNVGRA